LRADLAALICFNQSGAAELRPKTWLVRVHRLPKGLSHQGQASFRQALLVGKPGWQDQKYSAPSPQRRPSLSDATGQFVPIGLIELLASEAFQSVGQVREVFG